ncbi:SH3 domain-containing protein [Sphingomonas sp.]|uniref:SH3 domain-containing protein n=1 Tax=Sphingomonas sp. TaxID=28214 RepID=UPI0035BBFE68
MRLAAYVFAPHYAAPLVRCLSAPADLRLARDRTSEVVATLARGDRFEVLEFAGTLAWGIAPGPGLVGYLAADDLVAAQ